MKSRLYSTQAWRAVRLFVLERDGRTCRIGAAGCTITATHADHIVSPLDGGAFFDPGNLRASCERCNTSRGGRDGARKRQKADRLRSYPPALEW